MGSRDAGKAQAARDVCAASAVFSSCTHRRRSTRIGKAPFVDWYLVLSVSVGASEDAIRRRYRQLALQLHPDKNRHPKAEVAFKIISEAYACLTDKVRRGTFDMDRASSFCTTCHDRSLQTKHRSSTDKSFATKGRREAASQALREVQNRLRDECRIIENCLRMNDGRRRQSFPLFEPSECSRFPDYPHIRTRAFESNPWDFWQFRFDENQRWCRTGSTCESPVYQIRST